MWLGQRENIFRQDLDFSKREAANKLSIRQGLQGDELAMRRRSDYFDAATARGVSQFDQDTRHQGLEREWAWQQDTAAQEGAAYRARMEAQYLARRRGTFSAVVLLLVLGPVLCLVSLACLLHRWAPAGPVLTRRSPWQRSQADMPSHADNRTSKIAGAQMRMQEGIAKREAVISFMNTAIQGAKSLAKLWLGQLLLNLPLNKHKPKAGNLACCMNRLPT